MPEAMPVVERELTPLRDRALAKSPFLLRLLEQSSPCSILKHLAHTFVGLGRALQVLVRVDLLLESLALSSTSSVSSRTLI